MKRALLLVSLAALPALCGCQGMEHLRDLSEILILRGSVGLGVRASSRIGGLAHPGLGLNASYEFGLCHGPYAGVHGSADIILYHVEQCQDKREGDSGSSAVRDCECAGLALPLATCAGDYPWIQVADLEVSVFAGVIGVGIGISLGELLDFFTNLFGLDLDKYREDPPPPPRRPLDDP